MFGGKIHRRCQNEGHKKPVIESLLEFQKETKGSKGSLLQKLFESLSEKYELRKALRILI